MFAHCLVRLADAVCFRHPIVARANHSPLARDAVAVELRLAALQWRGGAQGVASKVLARWLCAVGARLEVPAVPVRDVAR